MIDIRASFDVIDGEVYPLGTVKRRKRRGPVPDLPSPARQEIRDRIAAKARR